MTDVQRMSVADELFDVDLSPELRVYIQEGRVAVAALQSKKAEIERLRMDSANYRASCDTCGEPHMDMLTDNYCAACKIESQKAEIERLQAELEEARYNAEWGYWASMSDDQRGRANRKAGQND